MPCVQGPVWSDAGSQPMQLSPPGCIEGSRKALLGCNRICTRFFSVQKEERESERLPAASCRLLHPARSPRHPGYRESMLFLCCRCSQPVVSWMLK